MAKATLTLSQALDNANVGQPIKRRGFQQSDLPTIHRIQATARRVRDMIHSRAWLSITRP